jgi:hypothetical protein
MPTSFQIDKEKRLVRSYAWGDVSFADIVQHRKALRHNPDFDDTYSQLCTWTAVTSIRLSPTEVKILANERLFARSSRHAFVVPAGLAFGMMRMFQAYCELYDTATEIMVSSDLPEALDWLNCRLAA